MMKPFGGYIPKERLSGNDEYVEFYRAEDVHINIERLKKELKIRDEAIQQQSEENGIINKQLEELQAQVKTARVVAEDHGKEILKTKDIIKKLRQFIEFYAQKSNWITIHDVMDDPQFGKFLVESDRGRKARKALKLIEDADTQT